MFEVWRPEIPESIDGLPLATKISDLFFDFPYDRIPADPISQYVLRPENVIKLLIFYLVSKPIFVAIAKMIDPKAAWFKYSVAIHNFLLAVFSFVVAANAWPVVLGHYKTYGGFETYCDPNGTLWASGFGAWSYIFYVSKFWEFVDTWILVFKGKDPSFLQVYHHTGIAFCMWVGTLSQSSWLVPVVLLNSIIHTLMYTYFLIKTISPTTQIKSAKYLTKAQIGQFFMGIFYSAAVLFMGEECDTQSSRFGLGCLQVYGYGLIGLFMAFSKRKYKKKD